MGVKERALAGALGGAVGTLVLSGLREALSRMGLVFETPLVMYLLALPMNALFGWSIPMIIIVTGISVLVYAILGGFEAVIWTDAIQGIILITGALACVVIILFSMPEGPAQVFTIAASDQKFSLGSFGSSLSEATFWVILIYGLFINLQNFGVDQNYVQRYLSAKTEKEAVKSTLLGSLLYVPVSLLFFFIGTALYAYYQARPGLLPEDLASIENADKIFPYFIVNGLPVGMTGLLIASIFAAGMSTISTSVNSSATIILTDHFKKYIHPGLSEKGEMRVLVLASLTMGLLSILVALAFNGVTSALDAWWALSAIFSGGILGLFLLGYIGKNIRRKYAAIGVVLGVLVIGWMSLSPVIFEEGATFRSSFHANLTIVFGTVVIFLVGFLCSAFANKIRSAV
jgi:SSS family solute:Na+ symporter